MKCGAEDGHGYDPKKFHKADPGVPHTKHALKVLITDGIAAAILGRGGQVKDEIQGKTSTKLVFSNRNDYFPLSTQRVLGIYGDTPETIMNAIEEFMSKLIEVAEEKQSKSSGGPEFLLGKKPNEYTLRLCVSVRTAGVLIGSGGANINTIRKESKAKVFVENESQHCHRLVRVIGGFKEIMSAVQALNWYVQQDSDHEKFFAEYASVINFSELEESAASSSGRPMLQALNHLADDILAMGDEKAKMLYCIRFHIASERVESLTEFAEQVHQETRCEISFDPVADDENQQHAVSVTGEIPWIYAAQAMLQHRLNAMEAEDRSDPEKLKQQIAMMQEKLRRCAESQ